MPVSGRKPSRVRRAAPFAVGQRPAGTRYGYHVEARFADDTGEGHRVEGRPCSLTSSRER
jgi:hypothetical protein